MSIYLERLNRVGEELQSLGAEAALITSPLSVAYLTGFMCDPHERFLGLLLQDNKAVLFLPSLEKEKAESELGSTDTLIQEIVGIQDTDNPYTKVKQNSRAAVRCIAVEKEYIKLSQAEQLSSVFENSTLVNVGGFISKLRNRKSADEILKIKAAAELVEEVLAEGLKKVKADITEIELVAELEYIMKKKGADAPAFDTMVLAGANSALPHGVPGKTQVKQGEFLLFDLGVFKDGYCSDITRTFVIGEPSTKLEHMYDTVLAAEEAAIRTVQIGRPLAEVDRAARDIIEGAGYGQYFTHRIGHGLGMEVHEYPSVHGANEEVMEAGAVFTIEPGIYVPGVGGVRIEDDIHVTDYGAEVLTSFPKTLTRLDI